jgi:hypothetical protein
MSAYPMGKAKDEANLIEAMAAAAYVLLKKNEPRRAKQGDSRAMLYPRRSHTPDDIGTMNDLLSPPLA